MSHSPYSPSGAYCYMDCAASPVVSQGLPDKGNKHADEGTAAHELGARALTQCWDDVKNLTQIDWEYDGKKFTHEVTDDMKERVKKYVFTVVSMSEGATVDYVEETFDLSKILMSPGEKGTADYTALLPEELQIHDYKNGYIPVDAEENEQMMLYAAGAIRRFELGIELDFPVRLVIHQPRRQRVSEWVTTVQRVLLFAEVDACEQIAKINVLMADPSLLKEEHFSPSEKTCRWCKKSGKCNAQAKFVENVLISDFEDMDKMEGKKEELLGGIPNERLALIYKHSAFISKFLSNVSDYALELSLNGEEIPGYKAIEGKKGSKSWADLVKAEQILKSAKLKMDDMFTKKLITATQALKLVKDKPRSVKKLEEVISLPGTAYKLVEESHKGTQVVLKDDFGDLDNDDISDLF